MRWTFAIALLAACLLPAAGPAGGTVPALAQDESAAILAPGEGQVVAGLVAITGAAFSPGFQRYELDFGYDPNVTGTWFPIQEPALAPQFGGTLGQWDTVGQGIADGVYVLRLRVYRLDGSFIEAFAGNITLQNGFGPGPAQPGLPPATPTPTGVFVDLPPTSTPRPTLTPHAPGLPRPGAGGDPAEPLLDLPAFGRAFGRGIAWTLALFTLAGLYFGLRPRLRPRVWRLMRRLVKPR